MPTQIQSVIAAQTLERTQSNGTITSVNINIGDLTYVPSTDPDSADSWKCWTEVAGLGVYDDYYYAIANDSMQAVYLAMARAGQILSGSDVVNELEDIGLPNFGYPLFLSSPNGSTVSGTVQLEACNDPAQNITFEFRTNDGKPPTVIHQILTPVSADTGSFSIPGVPDGTYDLAIKGFCWLRVVLPGVVVAGADVSGLSASLLGGDINNDNIIDTSDFNIVSGEFGQMGDP